MYAPAYKPTFQYQVSVTYYSFVKRHRKSRTILLSFNASTHISSLTMMPRGDAAVGTNLLVSDESLQNFQLSFRPYSFIHRFANQFAIAVILSHWSAHTHKLQNEEVKFISIPYIGLNSVVTRLRVSHINQVKGIIDRLNFVTDDCGVTRSEVEIMSGFRVPAPQQSKISDLNRAECSVILIKQGFKSI